MNNLLVGTVRPPEQEAPTDCFTKRAVLQNWETHFLPLLMLARRSAAPLKTSTGNNFPRKYLRTPRNDYQYWCETLVMFLPRWPQAGSQPFRTRNRRVFRFAGRKNKRWPLAILGLDSKSQEAHSDHGRKSQPHDFAAAAATGQWTLSLTCFFVFLCGFCFRSRLIPNRPAWLNLARRRSCRLWTCCVNGCSSDERNSMSDQGQQSRI